MAELVGADNVVFGTVSGLDRGVVHVRVGDVVLEATGDVGVSDDVVLLVRPEAIVLSSAAPVGVSARNRLAAVVTDVERRPHHVRVTVDAGGVRLVAAVVPVSVDELDLRAGRRVSVSVKATAVHAVRREKGTG